VRGTTDARPRRSGLRHQEIWNGNRESLRTAVWGRESLFGYALQSHFARRGQWPSELSALPVVRLRTTAGVEAFLTGAARRQGGEA
jgi:hypothetical protein